MKTVRAESLIGIVLIVSLVFCGVRFTRSLHALSQRSEDEERRSLGSDHSRVFRSETGVDVWGNQVHPLPYPMEPKTLVFMFRGSTLARDVEFWRNVDQLLPKGSGIRLVAYCDGRECTEAVRKSVKPPGFPVVAYGELTSSEAIVDADVAGNALLRSEEVIQAKSISWRTAGITPGNIVKEASQ